MGVSDDELYASELVATREVQILCHEDSVSITITAPSGRRISVDGLNASHSAPVHRRGSQCTRLKPALLLLLLWTFFYATYTRTMLQLSPPKPLAATSAGGGVGAELIDKITPPRDFCIRCGGQQQHSLI